ncbi:acyltransferase family protein [Paenibacillus koleovorans]|uniref:acyltransferase family protein n=1 Tax=Paenibacillus koleovorans TaxID=121608 RepID=UPI000FD75DDA|nr:acyltransferase family protein [Paenibacillus koleovorans]
MIKPIKNGGRYMPGLDGLRALAVLAVIAYHLHLDWATGGLLGVGVFFVLSGYLITDLLADQWRRNGKLDLRQFWIRRARRLLPAMFVMIAGVLVWSYWFNPPLLASLRNDVAASVLYVMNWWFVFREVSYFESFGPPSPLGHLWSLAVEEQFYLIWPLLFALGLRYFPQRGKLLFLTTVGIVASALAMVMLYEPGTDPSRVYYGTDTRAFGLLIGAALALVWPSRKLSAAVSTLGKTALNLTGAIGIGIILYLIATTNEYDSFLYRGGFVLLSIATALAVAALAHPASFLAGLFGCKPLRWLGVRSYGIYLWHYPIIVLSSPTVNTGGPDWIRIMAQIAATLILSDLSWRFVEEPIRQGAIGKLWRRTQTPTRGGRAGIIRVRLLVTTSSVLLALVLFCGGTINWYPTTTASYADDMQQCGHSGCETQGDTGSQAPPDQTPTPTPSGTPSATPAPTPSPTSKPSSSPTPTPTSTPGNKPDNGSHSNDGSVSSDITAIGDSVLLDVAPYLEKLLPGIVVEGKIGRQMAQASSIVDQLKSEGRLGNRVIIELGTNGAFSKKQLESLLHSLCDVQQVLLVNTRVPRPWEGEVNTMLAEVADHYANTKLVDWHSASENKDSFFYSDGVHLNKDGAQYYASMLADAMDPADTENIG